MAPPSLAVAVALRLASAALVMLLAAGCSTSRARVLPAPEPAPKPFHLAEVADRGDWQRRASNRLLLEGLGSEARDRPERALALYERALELDATNPWAFLALARHHAEGVAPGEALPFLDKTAALLAAGDPAPPGAEAHLVGLRGCALRALGRAREAAPLLERARQLAPAAWSDGRLDADELR